MLKALVVTVVILVVIGILADVFASKRERDRATRFRLIVFPAVLSGLIPAYLIYGKGVTTWGFASPICSYINALVFLKYASLMFSVGWWCWFFFKKHDQIFPPESGA